MAWMHFVSVPGKEAMLPQCTAMARGAPQEDFKEAAKLSLIKNISITFQGLLKNISLSDKKIQGLHNSLWRKNISRTACISLISYLDSFPSEKHNGCTMQQNFLSIWKIVSLLVITCFVLCFEMKHREYFRSFKSRLKIFEKIQIFGGVEKDGQAVGVKWEQIATVWGQKIATVGGLFIVNAAWTLAVCLRWLAAGSSSGKYFGEIQKK